MFWTIVLAVAIVYWVTGFMIWAREAQFARDYCTRVAMRTLGGMFFMPFTWPYYVMWCWRERA